MSYNLEQIEYFIGYFEKAVERNGMGFIELYMLLFPFIFV